MVNSNLHCMQRAVMRATLLLLNLSGFDLKQGEISVILRDYQATQDKSRHSPKISEVALPPNFPASNEAIGNNCSMISCRRTGFREDLVYSATAPLRRVWTRSALNTVKLLREISASSTIGVSHVSVKAMIDGSLEDIRKLISASLG